jgi:hypothetical protein
MTAQPASDEAATVLAFIAELERVFRCRVLASDITVRVDEEQRRQAGRDEK